VMEKLQQLVDVNTQVLRALNVRSIGSAQQPLDLQSAPMSSATSLMTQGLPVAIPQAQLVPTPQPALPQAHAVIISHPPTTQAPQPMVSTTTVHHQQQQQQQQQLGAHVHQVVPSSSAGGGEIGRKPSADAEIRQQPLLEKEKIFAQLNSHMCEMKKETELLHKIYREEVQDLHNMQQRLQMLEARLIEEAMKNAILQEKLEKSEAKYIIFPHSLFDCILNLYTLF
jgi:hypothetical protein